MSATLIFAVGMIIGAWIGMTLLSCCHLAKQADHAADIHLKSRRSGC
jgi:hypothetical protein